MPKKFDIKRRKWTPTFGLKPTEAIAEIMNAIENIKLVNKESWPLKRRRRLTNSSRRGSTVSKTELQQTTFQLIWQGCLFVMESAYLFFKNITEAFPPYVLLETVGVH